MHKTADLPFYPDLTMHKTAELPFPGITRNPLTKHRRRQAMSGQAPTVYHVTFATPQAGSHLEGRNENPHEVSAEQRMLQRRSWPNTSNLECVEFDAGDLEQSRRQAEEFTDGYIPLAVDAHGSSRGPTITTVGRGSCAGFAASFNQKTQEAWDESQDAAWAEVFVAGFEHGFFDQKFPFGPMVRKPVKEQVEDEVKQAHQANGSAFPRFPVPPALELKEASYNQYNGARYTNEEGAQIQLRSSKYYTLGGA